MTYSCIKLCIIVYMYAYIRTSIIDNERIFRIRRRNLGNFRRNANKHTDTAYNDGKNKWYWMYLGQSNVTDVE